MPYLLLSDQLRMRGAHTILRAAALRDIFPLPQTASSTGGEEHKSNSHWKRKKKRSKLKSFDSRDFPIIIVLSVFFFSISLFELVKII